jgi:hypothetical protein
MRRYFIAFIAAIILIILLIMLIFHGGSKPKVSKTNKALDTYASTNAEVILTIDGPINADQEHQSASITVSSDSTVYEQIQGYQGDVVKQESYPNNVDAYSNFLYALEHAGFTDGNSASDLANEKGYCPLGDRYIFELSQNGQNLERYWATSCGGIKTYNGSLGLTLTLFQDQVPDYQDLTNNLNF